MFFNYFFNRVNPVVGRIIPSPKTLDLNFIGKNAREPSAFIIVQFVWKWERCAKDV